MKTENSMDFHCTPDASIQGPYRRGPFAAWLLVALIGTILGVAMVAAGLTTDTRDFAARHGTVLKTQVL
jgi:hypothetical protein